MSVDKNADMRSFQERIKEIHPELEDSVIKKLSENQIERLLRGETYEQIQGTIPLKANDYHSIDQRAQEILKKKQTGVGYYSTGTYPRDSVSSYGSRVIRKTIRGE